MDFTDTVPSFILFAIHGCNAPGLVDDSWMAGGTQNTVRPVLVPLILLLLAATSLVIAFALWWRELPKAIPLALIGVALISVLGFYGYQVDDLYLSNQEFDFITTSGNYLTAVLEFSFYLLIVVGMNIVSLILVAREIGWEAERNVLGLTALCTVVLALCWVFFSLAVWNCV